MQHHCYSWILEILSTIKIGPNHMLVFLFISHKLFHVQQKIVFNQTTFVFQDDNYILHSDLRIEKKVVTTLNC